MRVSTCGEGRERERENWFEIEAQREEELGLGRRRHVNWLGGWRSIGWRECVERPDDLDSDHRHRVTREASSNEMKVSLPSW